MEPQGCGQDCTDTAPVDFATADEATRKRILIAQTARFASVFNRWLDTRASCDGLSYLRIQVLETLAGESPIMMRDLAVRLGISARNATALIDALEDAGLVERRPHPTDRRATLVALTLDGEAAARRETPQIEALGRLFDGFSPEEEDHLLAGLSHLMQAMKGPALKR